LAIRYTDLAFKRKTPLPVRQRRLSKSGNLMRRPLASGDALIAGGIL
jgi:hypothetical protein